MTYVFNLPDIGEGTADAEVVRWLVQVGDRVSEDDPVAELETDKAVVVMPAPATGTVTELGAPEGERVRVGDLLLAIDDGSAGAAAPVAADTPSPAGQGVPGVAPAAPSTGVTAGQPEPGPPPAPVPQRVAATPATRRLARELGVPLTGLRGSGPGGRLTDEDVRLAATSPSDGAALARPAAGLERRPEPPASRRPTAPIAVGGQTEDERIPVRGIRRRTAESMVLAAQEIPHTVAFHQADVGALLDLRKRLTARATAASVSLTLTPFLVKATALALARHPMANSSFDSAAQEIVVRGHRNIGVAASTPDGLVIPVVKDADRKPVLTIARDVERMTAAARNRTAALEDLQGGTFTITNHGPLGGAYGTPIIRPPEAGILGFGRAVPQPVVRDGQVVVATMLPISFSSDHRIVDGDLAIGFCLTLIDLLEDPVQLLVEDA